MKWSQVVIVTPESSTVVLAIVELHFFEDGDRLEVFHSEQLYAQPCNIIGSHL